ncbi:MAG: FHA domain-containing protein [Actinobacteria bacterium]|nr:FHA domain-containing protein [Actinomycetota bacterium]
MSLIRELERRFETILEGFFARQFRSGVQPIEVAKKLAREMDDNRTVSVSKIYAPNTYIVLVSPADAERLLPFKAKLCEEFSDFLTAHAQRESYAIIGRPTVEIEAGEGLGLGVFKIESSLVDRTEEGDRHVEKEDSKSEPDLPVDGTRVMKALRPEATLQFPDAKKVYPLSAERTTIGRAAANDVVIPDQSVSRRHAEIVRMGNERILRDLSSRNGTFLNGHKVYEHTLKSGDKIRIGLTTLIFRREPGV